MKAGCVYFIVLVLGYTSALTDEQAMLRYAKYIMVCAKGKPVEMTDLIKLQQLEVPTKPEVKCILACAYRKMGTLKSDGTFDLEASYKFAEECKDGDEKRLENGKKLADTCIKVNDEEVSDGDKGCERSALMYKCLITHAPKLGFNLRVAPEKMSEAVGL